MAVPGLRITYVAQLLFVLALVKINKCEEVTYKSLDSVGPVVFVNILYRHGDRTPINPYPNDPYKNLSYWPVGWGQLTNEGKLRHYELGKWLRNRYRALIGDHYTRNNVYILSTDVDRTLMSAEANLAGMYPPEGKEVWSSLEWQPIPIHTVPETSDKLLAMKANCPKYDEERKKLRHSAEMVNINSKYKEFYAYLTENSGKEVKDVEGIDKIYSTLTIEKNNNLVLPEWTAKVYPEPLRSAAVISFAIPCFNDALRRLKSGPLLKDMITHFDLKQTGKMKPDRNMWIYSAHDTTVANLLNAMGVFDLQAPPFAATVMVELRRNANQQHFVTVLYKNSTEGDPFLLTIPGCNSVCPLDKFKSLLAHLIPGDWDSECHSHQFFDLTPDLPYNSLAVFAMVTSTLLVFLLLASTSLYWYKQAPSNFYRKLATETL